MKILFESSFKLILALYARCVNILIVWLVSFFLALSGEISLHAHYCAVLLFLGNHASRVQFQTLQPPNSIRSFFVPLLFSLMFAVVRVIVLFKGCWSI